MSSSVPYDPYIPPSQGAAQDGHSKTAAVQSQIDDAVSEMRKNLNKVAQRGEDLDGLRDKSDNLVDSSNRFRHGANQVRKRMWWKDMKMRMCIIAVILILIIVIVVPIAVHFK